MKTTTSVFKFLTEMNIIATITSCPIIPPLVERGLYCNHLVSPSVHTFVKDVSAATGRNDFIFDTWLWHSDLYRVSPFQTYRCYTRADACLNLQTCCYTRVDVCLNFHNCRFSIFINKYMVILQVNKSQYWMWECTESAMWNGVIIIQGCRL